VPPADFVVLLRLSGEVSTKAPPTRRAFATRLVRNAKDALASEGIEAVLARRHERIVVETADARAPELLARVFGVQSVSRAERHPVASLDDVVSLGAERFGEAVRGRRFAVRARGVGDPRLPFRGHDVEVALGERLRPASAGVDLDHPEVTARIELYEGHAYLFTDTLPGVGGLPLGTGDRAVALVSGGFDSAVAAWQLSRRGVVLDHVFANLGGRTHRLGVLRVMELLARRWCYGTRPHLHVLDFSALSQALQTKVEARYRQVVLKRLMLRAAERVAHERHALAIVTGEAVGQVSSQTLANLATISEATRLPILRPLVGMNKDEIVAAAHRIGTGPLSAAVQEYCALVPRRPATQARLDAVLAEEAQLDLGLLDEALAEREVLDLRALSDEASALDDLELSEIPEGAVVIDLRTRSEYQGWHWPGALHLDWAQALEAHPSFAKEQRYVLYCEYGLKSAHLAELMRRLGLEAFHVRGGAPALRKRQGSQQQPSAQGPRVSR
jgi:thiamine biosynthesis protein ThiI